MPWCMWMLLVFCAICLPFECRRFYRYACESPCEWTDFYLVPTEHGLSLLSKHGDAS